MSMLQAIKLGDYDQAEAIRETFEPLEDLRNEINPIRVLHRAVELAGIANTGPIQPLLSDVPAESYDAIADAAKMLISREVSA